MENLGNALCIIDYGMGNLSSVASALASLGCRATISDDPAVVAKADALILPGVGAFGEAMVEMHRRKFIPVLEQRVLADRVPFLGICLGMQLVARRSSEGGMHEGLGWIDAEVHRIPDAATIRIPHIGWNEVTWRGDAHIQGQVEQGSHFYFNHSFCMMTDDANVVATTDVGRPLVAAIEKDNIWGVQFHPEKSHNTGRRLLRAFLNAVQNGQAAHA